MISKFHKHIFVLLIISLISLICSFVVNNKFAGKQTLKVKYQLDNYYLTTEQSLYPLLSIIIDEIENEQYSIRDNIYKDPNCNFLNPKFDTFSIIRKQRDEFEIELFTNDEVNKESLFGCFNSFEENLNNFKNDLLKNIFSRREQKLNQDLTSFNKILKKLNELNLGLSLLIEISDIENQISLINNFLESNLQKSILVSVQKKYDISSLNPKLIFISIFFTILAAYIVLNFSKKDKSKRTYKKILNKILN